MSAGLYLAKLPNTRIVVRADSLTDAVNAARDWYTGYPGRQRGRSWQILSVEYIGNHAVVEASIPESESQP